MGIQTFNVYNGNSNTGVRPGFIAIQTSRYKLHCNWVQVSFEHNMSHCQAGIIDSYVQERFPNLNIKISNCHGMTSASIRIQDGHQGRNAIDLLFQNNEITNHDRLVIEPSLSELEKCLRMCAKLTESITTDQADMLRDFCEPHIEVLKTKAPNIAVAEEWLRSIIFELACDDNFERLANVDQPSNLHRVFYHYQEYKNNKIFRACASLGQVTAGRANLEDRFLQFGTGLPSLKFQQEFIISMLKESQTS
jgi:hypothetical protein